jgi:hypothetical protein
VRALTTTPASPQALASVRRIAAGVVLAGCTGLAVGLGSWWVAGLSSNAQAEPSGTGQTPVAQAARPDVRNVPDARSVEGASPGANTPAPGMAADGTSADVASPPPAEQHRRGQSELGTKSAASSSSSASHKTSAPPLPRSERRSGSAQGSAATAPAGASTAADDPFDNRY